MQRKLMWVSAFTAVVVSAATYAGTLLATPASGFVGTTIAVGRLPEIDVMNHVVTKSSDPADPRKQVWLSLQKTKGLSDLYVQSNVWAAGGTTGWHTHPGQSLITVTAGAVTAYEGDDPSCTPQVYTVGMSFVDPGGNHVHVLRNEGAVEARTIAVQLVPAGAARRLDAAGSPGCAF
jgi:quercetin dioxygenase-like cupin family protein